MSTYGGRGRVVPVVLPVIATLLLGAVSLYYPFGRDQGEYAQIADMVLGGAALYRDVFYFGPPLATAVHALALVLFGYTMAAIRILDLVWTAATALLVCLFVGRAFRDRWLGAGAGVLYSFLYYPLGYWHTAQPDGWLNLPIAAALLLALVALERPEERSRIRWLGAGAFISAAVLFKYPAALALPGLAAVVFVTWRRTPRRALRACALMAAGFTLPLLADGVWLLASGALPSFIESHSQFLPRYVALDTGSGARWPVVELMRVAFADSRLRPGAVLAELGAIPLALVLARRVVPASWHERRVGALLLVLWLAAGCASTCWQSKFFVYHYLTALPAGAALGALTFGTAVSLAGRVLRRTWQRVVVAVALGAVAYCASDNLLILRDLPPLLTGHLSSRQYQESWRHDTGGDFSLRDNLELADYFRAVTEPDERVFIWGFEPMVYFLARRQPVSRFVFALPLAVDWAPSGFREEFLGDWDATPPELFAVERGDAMPWVTGDRRDSEQALAGFFGLRERVASDYVLEKQFERFDVYRRSAVD